MIFTGYSDKLERYSGLEAGNWLGVKKIPTMKRHLEDAAESLQSRLELLQHGMNSLRLAASVPMPNSCQPPATPLGPVTFDNHGYGGSRDELFSRLMNEVSRLSGIQCNDAMRVKLERMWEEKNDRSLLLHLAGDLVPRQERELWQTLVEKLTVHETYFNRDGHQLELIRKEELSNQLARQRGEVYPKIRIWSAATSTGEEAYTLAIMVLLELAKLNEVRITTTGELLGVFRWAVEILGTDISNLALQRANSGRYLHTGGALSPFREIPAEFKTFFDFSNCPTHPGAQWGTVKPAVRRLVSFQQHNLVSSSPPCDQVDLVLCRNVMIYFDEPTRLRVQRALWQALKPGGALVLGPSDLLLLPELFTPKWGERSVYYIKH